MMSRPAAVARQEAADSSAGNLEDECNSEIDESHPLVIWGHGEDAQTPTTNGHAQTEPQAEIRTGEAPCAQQSLSHGADACRGIRCGGQ